MFEQFKYQNNYNKENYARMSVLIPIEDKEIIEEHRKKLGYKSFSSYALELIRKDIFGESKNKTDIHDNHIETININN